LTEVAPIVCTWVWGVAVTKLRSFAHDVDDAGARDFAECSVRLPLFARTEVLGVRDSIGRVLGRGHSSELSVLSVIATDAFTMGVATMGDAFFGNQLFGANDRMMK
jgi:hypothetical protein